MSINICNLTRTRMNLKDYVCCVPECGKEIKHREIYVSKRTPYGLRIYCVKCATKKNIIIREELKEFHKLKFELTPVQAPPGGAGV